MPQSGRPEVNPFAVQCTLNLCIATPQKKRSVGLIEFHWRLGSLRRVVPTFRPTAGSHVSGSLVKFLLLG